MTFPSRLKVLVPRVHFPLFHVNRCSLKPLKDLDSLTSILPWNIGKSLQSPNEPVGFKLSAATMSLRTCTCVILLTVCHKPRLLCLGSRVDSRSHRRPLPANSRGSGNEMVVSYVVGHSVTSHFLRQDGKTVCGRLPQGRRWFERMRKGNLCRKCSQRIQLGVSRLFTCCPKCLSDLNQQIPLRSDRSCPNCRGEWN